MKYQNCVFGQLLQLIDRDKFQSLVTKYKGDFKTHKLNCWSQFACMMYAQLRQRDSLRDIQVGLEAQFQKLYHLGLSQAPKRSTLSDANNKRPYQIYETLFYHQLHKCQHLVRNKKKLPIPVSCLDTTIINLCHSVFPWTKYGVRKGGLKLHFHYQYETDLPDFMTVTDAQVSDLAIGRALTYKPDSILLFDRGYYDYKWFYALDQQGVTFITRTKSNFTYAKIGQHDIDPESDVLEDLDVVVPCKKRYRSYGKYPKPIRYIRYQDPQSGEILGFLTNNETFEAETVVKLYKLRWEIELFFKWIKQHLKIKTFLGTSKNAVLSQLWIAMTLYLLLWYIRQQVCFTRSLHTLVRIFNEMAFERVHIIDIIGLSKKTRLHTNQTLPLFSFP